MGPLAGMLRRAALLKDTAWAGVGEIAQLVSTLGSFYLLTTRLGPADYGYFVGVQALVAMLVMASSGWISLLLLQETVREGRRAEDAYSSCLTLALLVAGPVWLVALGAGAVLLPGLSLAVVALFAVAELVGTGAVLLAAALVQASGAFSASARIRTGYLLGRLVLLVLLVLLSTLSLQAVALLYAGYGLLAGVVVTLVVARQQGVRLRPRVPALAEVRSGLTYAGTSALFAVQEDADKTLLVRLGDPVSAGLYGAAYRGVQLGMLPIRALLSATHRRFLLDDGTAGQHRTRSLRYTGMAVGYALPAAVLLAVLAPLVPVLLGEEYAASAELVPLLAPLVLLRAGSLFAFNGLLGLRRNGLRVAVLVVSALLNVVSLLLLVPGRGAQGAAYATLLAEAAFLALTWCALLVAQRRSDRRAPLPVPVG